jgi:hypothetical protein
MLRFILDCGGWIGLVAWIGLWHSVTGAQQLLSLALELIPGRVPVEAWYASMHMALDVSELKFFLMHCRLGGCLGCVPRCTGAGIAAAPVDDTRPVIFANATCSKSPTCDSAELFRNIEQNMQEFNKSHMSF